MREDEIAKINHYDLIVIGFVNNNDIGIQSERLESVFTSCWNEWYNLSLVEKLEWVTWPSI